MISNTIIKNITNIQKSGLDIVIIGAVGQKNKIDERFLKYDMFDNQVFLELPGAEERKRLFQINIQKAERRAKLKLFDPDILEELVKKTE
jgi:SpoVK/Ycf46/Vps4 family AAA+-type ATPase